MSGSCSVLEQKIKTFCRWKKSLSVVLKNGSVASFWKWWNDLYCQRLEPGNAGPSRTVTLSQHEFPQKCHSMNCHTEFPSLTEAGLSQHLAPQPSPNISKVWEAKSRILVDFQCCPGRGCDPTGLPGWFCSPKVLKVLFYLLVLPFQCDPINLSWFLGSLLDCPSSLGSQIYPVSSVNLPLNLPQESHSKLFFSHISCWKISTSFLSVPWPSWTFSTS